MIGVIFGTTGELIKLAPVLVRLRDRGVNVVTLTTGQQVNQIPPLLDSFGLPQPSFWLARGHRGEDLRRNSDVPRWLASVGAGLRRCLPQLRSRLRQGDGSPLVLVHGDTMTTVLGAATGRLLRVSVAHIEAGLRSFDLRHPFPEELNRRLTSRFATIHYAPGAWAAGNLRRGTVVDTGSNTIRDSLELCRDADSRQPRGAFGLVSLHRFELLNDQAALEQTLRVLARHAQETPMLFVDHPVTVAAIDRWGLQGLFEGGLTRMPRCGFCEFVSLMRRAAFVVTDSGGSQEESYYLDVPCLVHRKRTERPEGLGENVVLSRSDVSAVERFLEDPSGYRRAGSLPPASASDIIVDHLLAGGFAR